MGKNVQPKTFKHDKNPTSTRTEAELIMNIKTGIKMTPLYKIPGIGSTKIIIASRKIKDKFT